MCSRWQNFVTVLKMGARLLNHGLDFPLGTWIENFRNGQYKFNLAYYFFTTDINVIKKIKVQKKYPLLVTLCKNDLIRLQKFVEYHRNIGVRQFVVIDNDSDDGSVEWLQKQEDIFLVQVKDQYSAAHQEAWYNRILAHFGTGYWYIILDSDEFLTYQGMEEHNVDDLVKWLKKHKVYKACSFMLDMYAEKGYAEHGQKKEFLEQCIYFDADSYTAKNRNPWVEGGPRKRIFSLNNWITKYPILYLQEGDILGTHSVYPNDFTTKPPCHIILKHYKFLPGDKNVYQNYVDTKIHWNNSSQYARYLDVWKEKGVLDFMYKGSVKYKDSESLCKLSVYDGIDWNK